MKRILYFASAALVFGLASCSQEDMPGLGGSEGNVHFKVTLPTGLDTRAFGDGYTAGTLEMAVYNAATDELLNVPSELKFDDGSLTKEVNLTLAKGKSYKIAFFAHDKGNSAYSFNPEDANITVNYAGMASNYNTDSQDCFYALYETGVIKDALTDNVLLYRPVAQVNWGTSDLSEPAVTDPSAYDKDDNNEAKNLVSNVKVVAYNEFNLLTGDVAEGDGKTAEVNLGYLPRPSHDEVFLASPTTHKYLQMCYLMMPKAGTNVDLTLEVATEANGTTMSEITVTNAPVQANYRTNIFGALLTSPAIFTVTKHEGFEDDFDINQTVDPGDVIAPGLNYNKDEKTYSVASVEGLKALAKKGVTEYAGKTIRLIDDIDMQGETFEPLNLWSPEKNITFDGNNHTIKNIKFDQGTTTLFSSLTGTVQNLKIDGMEGEVNSRFTGLVGNLYGTIKNVHVKNVKIVSSEGRVGAIVGIHNTGALENCSVENADITGAWSVGGMVGATNSDNSTPTYINCIVKNIKVTNTGAYGGVYNKMVGMLTGNINTDNVVFTNCQVLDCGDITLPVNDSYVDYTWNGTLIKANIDESGNAIGE